MPKSRNIIIGTVYRPPYGKLKDAISHLNKCVGVTKSDRKDLFLIGDWNVDYKKKTAENYKSLSFFEKSHGLNQLISTSTRNTNKTSTLVDLILTDANYICNSGTLPQFISDHQPIFAIKKKVKQIKINKEFRGRSYRNFNKNTFTENLLTHDWAPFYNATCVDHAWDVLYSKILDELDLSCPFRTFKIPNYRPDWMSDELIENIKDRDYFYRKAKRTKDVDDWEIAKYLRNKTSRQIEQAKKNFICEALRTHKSDPKHFWRTINTVFPTKNKKNRDQILLKTVDNIPVKVEDTADHINTFFATVGKLSKTQKDRVQAVVEDATFHIRDDPLEYLKDQTNIPLPPERFELQPFTETQVFNAIKDININKSSGLENVKCAVLKEALMVLIPQMKHLFNLSVRSSQFPNAWKNATVVPIPKTGDLKLVSNYRPISLLPVPGKILERLVAHQLNDFIESNDLFTPSQFGFRKAHSTVQAVATLLNTINENYNRSSTTTACFVDFRKAFDCVQHKVLLHKLEQMYIGPNALEWIENYFVGRRQRTIANNIFSNFTDIAQGVAQGSILGPLFYIAYANDLANVVKHGEVLLYADDTVLFSKKKSIKSAHSDLQKDLDNLSEWCNDNGIFPNLSKTKVMTFGSPTILKKNSLPNLKMNSEPLERVNSYTYLGLTLDQQLNLRLHTNKLINRVSNKIRQLRKIRHLLNTKASLAIYKNAILPILEYGDIFFCSLEGTIKSKLQTLQNRALKCALSKENKYSTTLIHFEAKLDKLAIRRKHHILLYMFREIAQGRTKFKNTSKRITTRLSKKKNVRTNRPKLEKYKKSLTYVAPKLWNTLPVHLQKTESYPLFNISVLQNLRKKEKEKKIVVVAK